MRRRLHACAANYILQSFQEFSVYFGNGRERSECIGILAQNALQFPDLTLADHTHEHRFFLMGIHARRSQFRHAVVQLRHDLGGDLLRMIGNDLKPVRHLESAQDRIARFARHKQGDERKPDRA